MAIDFLLDDDNDIQFDANGELVIGESELQDVALIIQTNPGEWKEDPIMGLGLPRFVKSKENQQLIERELKIQLTRDNKDYNRVKNKIELKLNTGGN